MRGTRSCKTKLHFFYYKNKINMVSLWSSYKQKKFYQNCLEIFFSAIRAEGGLHDHPSQLHFKFGLRSYILGKWDSFFFLI